MSKKKWKKGEPITSLDELVKQEIIFMFNKPTHYGWFMSCQFRMVYNLVREGRVFKAVPTAEVKDEV